MAEERMRTGTLYWPRRKGPFIGAESDFDRGEIQDELSHIADVGFDFVRVALPWESLQPAQRRIRSSILDQLAALLDAADHAGLAVQLTLAGQLGGTLFVPRWMLASEPENAGAPLRLRLISEGWETTWPLGNLYEDTALMAAQRWLWSELVTNFTAHPALVEVDPGAGGLLSAAPPMREEPALAWWDAMVETIKGDGPSLRLLYTDRTALLVEPTLPSVDEWWRAVGLLALAAAPASSALARSGIDVEWPLFMLRLARTLAGGAIACASLGVATTQGADPANGAMNPSTSPPPSAQILSRYAEEEQARFFDELLPALSAEGTPFVCHATWADAPPELYAQPPYDRNLLLRHSGLLRADGSEKEAATTWRNFHNALRSRRSSEDSAAPPPRSLAVDRDEWYQKRQDNSFAAGLYRRFLEGEI